MFIVIKGYTIPLTTDNNLVYGCVERTDTGLELSSKGYANNIICKQMSTYSGYHDKFGCIFLSKSLRQCWIGEATALHQCKSYMLRAT